MKRCNQCWQKRPDRSFIGARGLPVTWCKGCRARRDADGYVRAEPRRGLRTKGTTRVRWSDCSKNRKLGGIPASITSAETCPDTCGFFGQGCYAEFHLMRVHWAAVGRIGQKWEGFLRNVRALPAGSLWRHNEAGDLPGVGRSIAVGPFLELVMASVGRRGFTFTHKRPRTTRELMAFRAARDADFTINLSADSLEQADELADLGIAPVAVVVPSSTPATGTLTPAGRKVVVCPNETAGLTCRECQLCARPHRQAIIAFRAHGQMKRHVSELVQLRRKERAVG